MANMDIVHLARSWTYPPVAAGWWLKVPWPGEPDGVSAGYTAFGCTHTVQAGIIPMYGRSIAGGKYDDGWSVVQYCLSWYSM